VCAGLLQGTNALVSTEQTDKPKPASFKDVWTLCFCGAQDDDRVGRVAVKETRDALSHDHLSAAMFPETHLDIILQTYTTRHTSTWLKVSRRLKVLETSIPTCSQLSHRRDGAYVHTMELPSEI